MKKVIVLSVLCCFLIISCKTTQSSRSSTNSEIASADSERDGSSIEKAVIAKNVSSEYEWIAKNYPNSQVLRQALISKGKKHYDKLTVKLADGSERDFYFDINSFFGKF